MSTKFKFTLIVALGFIFALFAALFHRNIQVLFGNGGVAHIRPASFLASLMGSGCNIDYQTREGKAGKVALWQDLFHHLIAVVPAPDSNVLLCVYDFDTDLRVLRIDTTRAFASAPAPTATTSSCLSAVVLSSSWDIQEGKIDDWQ